MAKRFYPAVLERGAKETFAVWFPDFPDCVAAGRSQEEAVAKAEAALARSVATLVEREEPLPASTPFEKIAIPKGCEVLALFAVSVEPPDPSERVNIYLPKSLIARADKRAAELGMSRSSFFGFAVSQMIGWSKATGLMPGAKASVAVRLPKAKAKAKAKVRAK